MILSNNAKKYGFNQITTALLAFVQSFESKIHEYLPDIPVFVLWSGDNNIYMDTKFSTHSGEIYEKNPRVVIRFTTVEEDQESRTNKYNRYFFLSSDDNSVNECKIRRLQLWFNCEITFVSPNFIDSLTYYEIILGIISRECSFTYEYQGSVFNAAFSSDSSQTYEFPETDSGTRNFIQKLDAKIQLHLYVPRIETIKEYSETDASKVIIGIKETPDSADITGFEWKNNSNERKDVNTPYTHIDN